MTTDQPFYSKIVRDAATRAAVSTLLSKNVRIHNRRTSVRLEPMMWEALYEIAALEDCSIHALCSGVYDLKNPETSFTAALRSFLMLYYRSAALMDSRVTLVQNKLKARAADVHPLHPPTSVGNT